MKRILIISILAGLAVMSCGKTQAETTEKSKGADSLYTQYLDTLKSENNLKITMGGKPVTIVGKETKIGDKLKEVPLTMNSKLEDKNILEDKAVKVIYTAPSLDTKVCSIQTKMLNTAAPFAQERFCSSNGINSLKPASDYKYHQFGIQNGLLIKEAGLLTRALMIVNENNIVKYIEYVKEEGNEADVDKAMKFLEKEMVKK